MTLYYDTVSSHSRIAHAVAKQAKVDIEVKRVNLHQGEQRDPEFIKLNPNGKIPVYVEGDFVLSESFAIARHLLDKAGNTDLYPGELRTRAKFNELLGELDDFKVKMSAIVFATVILPRTGKNLPEGALNKIVADFKTNILEWNTKLGS